MAADHGGPREIEGSERPRLQQPPRQRPTRPTSSVPPAQTCGRLHLRPAEAPGRQVVESHASVRQRPGTAATTGIWWHRRLGRQEAECRLVPGTPLCRPLNEDDGLALVGTGAGGTGIGLVPLSIVYVPLNVAVPKHVRGRTSPAPARKRRRDSSSVSATLNTQERSDPKAHPCAERDRPRATSWPCPRLPRRDSTAPPVLAGCGGSPSGWVPTESPDQHLGGLVSKAVHVGPLHLPCSVRQDGGRSLYRQKETTHQRDQPVARCRGE